MATERSRIPAPDLDDRTWADLSQEARALIPRYAPQWTDHSESDIGITLIELFAFLTESLIYRLNQVPEKNYSEFLNLLGIRRDPAEAAKAQLVFGGQPPNPVTVPAGTQAQTQATETEQPVVFETDRAVTVLPIDMKSALWHAGPTYRNRSAGIARPGGSSGLSLALPTGYSFLALGFNQPTTADLVFELELVRPLAPGPAVTVTWGYSTGASNALAVAPVQDDTGGLRGDGLVRLQIPTTWSSQPPGAALSTTPATPADTEPSPFYWLFLRFGNTTASPVPFVFRSLLFNAAPAYNALSAGPEALGQSDGSPFQSYALQHAPLFRKPRSLTPYDHLDVKVGGVSWTGLADLPAGPGQVYRLDPVAGEIMFGDHDATTRPKGHGSIPAAGATIEATAYRYVVGGARGNVGGGAISVLRTPVVGVSTVVNPAPAEGGADEEPVEEAKRRAPQLLRNRQRAVTAEDYEYLAREASTEVAVVRSLPPRVHDTTPSGAPWLPGDPWTFAAIDRGPGNVNVIVVPRVGQIDGRPEPGRELVEEVQGHLDARRDLTGSLRVLGPRYLPIRVNADVWVWQRAIDQGLIVSATVVYADVRDRIKAFLHPITGGPDGRGWEIGQHVFVSDIYAAAMPSERLGYIASLTLEAELPLYHYPPLGPGGPYSAWERPEGHTLPSLPAAWVRVAEYELICAGTINLTQNVAQS